MSLRSLNALKNISKNNYVLNNAVRNYSRKLSNNDEAPYKHVKPRNAVPEDSSNLVERDPNFELLASNEFPLFLRGNIGIAWYDTQTTMKTHHELIMEQIDDGEDKNANIVCSVQACPTVLKDTVKDLFPYRKPDGNSELSVITIRLKPDIKHMRKNRELETEKLAQIFLITAKDICDKLRRGGYWADFINPFSGRPYYMPSALSDLYETDEKFRCLDFQIFEVKDCKVIANDVNSQKTFIGSLFTNAPNERNHLNSIFTL